MAAPFDLERLELSGPAVRVDESYMERAVGPADAPLYGVSTQGTLVYVRGGSTVEGGHLLVSVDREGNQTSLSDERRRYQTPRLSPAGDRLVYEDVGVLWVRDLARGTTTRLTFDPSFHHSPVWTPDGRRVAFRRLGVGILWKPADGTGQAEVLLALGQDQRGLQPHAFTPDGKGLIYLAAPRSGPGEDLHVLTVESGESRELLSDGFDLIRPSLSPDGRWLAYTSDESGSNEVYVRPYPDVEAGKEPVSTGGGHSPVWSPDGSELFYLNGRAMIGVDVHTGADFRAGSPRVLFEGDFLQEDSRHYSIHPDGESFVMVSTSKESSSQTGELIVVQNWFEELKRLVPTD
jgi:serine/threonine-protein kinase